jgi:hypothetical protein
MHEVLPASWKTPHSDTAILIPHQFHPHRDAESSVQSRDTSARLSKNLMPNPQNQVILVMEMTMVNLTLIPIPSPVQFLKQTTRYLTPTRMQRQTVRNRSGRRMLAALERLADHGLGGGAE